MDLIPTSSPTAIEYDGNAKFIIGFDKTLYSLFKSMVLFNQGTTKEKTANERYK